MRKIKVDLRFVVPSWNYCNYDSATASLRPSKEICRFCRKDKLGYRCVLFDKNLSADAHFIYKVPTCIDATAGFAAAAEDQIAPQIDPKLLMREAVKNYKKTVDELIKMGYPRNIAETVALKDMLEDK